MPDQFARTPGSPTVQGTRVTLDTILKQPKVVSRVIVPTPEVFLSTFLFRQDTTESGAMIFNRARANGAYPTKGDVREIAPGADFPTIQLGEDTPEVAVATKYGLAFEVTDESVQRKAYDEIGRGLLLSRNALRRQDAYRCYQAFVDAGVPTRNAVAKWNDPATANPLRDLLTAVADIRNTRLGYAANTVLINPRAALEFQLNEKIQKQVQVGNESSNPWLSPTLGRLLGLNWVENEFLPEGEVLVLQANISGVNFVERDTEVEPIRQSGQKTLVQVSRRAVPIITDPGAAVRIQGVLV